MEEPKVKTRHRVVIARIPRIQKPKHLLIEEIKPEETMVLAGASVHGEIKVRRIPYGGQHVPRDRDHDKNQNSGERIQPLPSLAIEKTACEHQKHEGYAQRKHQSDQALK